MWELFWPLCKSPACLWALRMQTCGVCWCFPFCFKKWHLQTWKTGWTALPEETEIWGPWAAGMTLIKIVLSTCWLRSTRLELVWYAESGPRNGQHCRHAKTLCSRSHVAYKGIPCTYCLHTPVPAEKSCLWCEAWFCNNHINPQKFTRSYRIPALPLT